MKSPLDRMESPPSRHRALARAGVLLMLHAIPLTGCGGSEPAAAVAPTTAAAAAPAPAPPSSEVTPHVVSVTPDGISVRDGRGYGQLRVAYEITNPDRVEKAELELWAPGVGRVAREPVPIVERGEAFISVNGDIDLGPALGFRVRCPGGDSDWASLGTRGSATSAEEGVIRITNVQPEYISLDRAYMANEGDIPEGAGARVTLSGPGLGEGCTPEASINGRPVELTNPFARGGRPAGRVEGFLHYRDLGNRYVASRFLEVKLHVRGPGVGRVNYMRLPFVE